jgi:hypothetical protein
LVVLSDNLLVAIAVPVGFFAIMKAESSVGRLKVARGRVFLRNKMGNFAQQWAGR